MPRVNWNVGREVIDDFDREAQFAPYKGKTPPNAVYMFKLKNFRYAAGTREKNPRLSAGLELVPRTEEEKTYRGYYITKFMAIAETNAFQWVPMLDALGVTSVEFLKGTICDEEGNIRKIGNWRMDGKTMVLGQLADTTDQHGLPRKEIKWVGAVEDSETYEEAEEEETYDDDEGF